MSRDIRAQVLEATHTISRTLDELHVLVRISNPPHDLLPARGDTITVNFPEPITND